MALTNHEIKVRREILNNFIHNHPDDLDDKLDMIMDSTEEDQRARIVNYLQNTVLPAEERGLISLQSTINSKQNKIDFIKTYLEII